MSGSNKLVLDCDGVLLDWNVGFRAWMARHEFHEKNDLIIQFQSAMESKRLLLVN